MEFVSVLLRQTASRKNEVRLSAPGSLARNPRLEHNQYEFLQIIGKRDKHRGDRRRTNACEYDGCAPTSPLQPFLSVVFDQDVSHHLGRPVKIERYRLRFSIALGRRGEGATDIIDERITKLFSNNTPNNRRGGLASDPS